MSAPINPEEVSSVYSQLSRTISGIYDQLDELDVAEWTLFDLQSHCQRLQCLQEQITQLLSLLTSKSEKPAPYR